jgi:hypothetical protein
MLRIRGRSIERLSGEMDMVVCEREADSQVCKLSGLWTCKTRVEDLWATMLVQTHVY